MAWYDSFFPGAEKTAPAPVPVILPLEKIDANILRFKRAVEQCGKGGNRLSELNKNLAYWEAMRNLAVLGE